MTSLLAEQMFVLFAILAIGSWLGRLSLAGISLGGAGVLFVAMLFGHFGLSVPRAIMELGLLLFVYAVGLQAGPSFFRTFRRRGFQYVAIGFITVVAGLVAAIALTAALKLPFDLAAGLYAGAMTCTPALAAAIDALERISPGSGASVSVGYGIAYPYAMIAVVLLIQFLPRLLRREVKKEEAAWQQEKSQETPCIEAHQYVITNPNVDGLRVHEINPRRMILANISRVKHGEKVYAATPEMTVHLGDVVMVVGPCDELDKMRMLLGEETHTSMDMNTDVVAMDVEVTQPSLAGKRLSDMRVFERYNVVITRIRRQGLELAPTGRATLEMGDGLRIVGEKTAVEEFARLVHGQAKRIDETNMVSFLFGLLLGIALGAVPIPLSNGLVIKLGSAGGAFLVSLVLGHFGRIGPIRVYVPMAAKNLSRELGLMLFLAGAGVTAGSQFTQILAQRGAVLLLAGAAITTFSVLVGLVVMHLIYKQNLLSTMGALSAAMTNPPALGAATSQTDSDLPTLSYASVYPVALIFKIVLAQILVQILAGMLR